MRKLQELRLMNIQKVYCNMGKTVKSLVGEVLVDKCFTNGTGSYFYVKELDVNNKKFNEVLNQYDALLKETTDDKAISTICNQVLSKYEELVINVESKGDTTN